MTYADELLTTYTAAPRCVHLLDQPGQPAILRVDTGIWRCHPCHTAWGVRANLQKGQGHPVAGLRNAPRCDRCGDASPTLSPVAAQRLNRSVVAEVCTPCLTDVDGDDLIKPPRADRRSSRGHGRGRNAPPAPTPRPSGSPARRIPRSGRKR